MVTERHSAPKIVYDPKTQTAEAHDQHDSALWVLALPALEEHGLLNWASRGFGKPEDDAGLDIVAAVGDDCFLESRKDEGSESYALRIWRLRGLPATS